MNHPLLRTHQRGHRSGAICLTTLACAGVLSLLLGFPRHATPPVAASAEVPTSAMLMLPEGGVFLVAGAGPSRRMPRDQWKADARTMFHVVCYLFDPRA